MKHTIRRYSEAFRRQVVSEYEAGTPIPDLRKKYGINGNGTITYWIHKYAKEGFRHELVRIQTAAEAQQVRELERKVLELQQALGKMTLEKLKLESILEILQEEAQGGKKNEPPSSNGSGRRSNPTASCE